MTRAERDQLIKNALDAITELYTARLDLGYDSNLRALMAYENVKAIAEFYRLNNGATTEKG